MRSLPRLLCFSLLSFVTVSLLAEPVDDCALRDEPFSLDSPLLDILLNERAKAIVQEAMPSVFEHLPADMFRTEAPSFAAIITLKSLAAMSRAGPEVLEPIASELAAIPVSDEDRQLRCRRYDNERPAIELQAGGVNLLVFRKINGFDHGPSVDAADEAIRQLGKANGWNVVVTDKAGVFTADLLDGFNAVIWNNNSGDVLTLSQRAAFENYINNGGAFLGLHGAGGDFAYSWPWYRDTLLGAQFIGHPMEPQFQDARLDVEATFDEIGRSVASGWTMNDEWYSFASNPRTVPGVNVITTIDENSYSPVGMGGQDLRMGDDHPLVWRRCVNAGRAAYSAIGHRVEVYEVEQYMTLLSDLLGWVANENGTKCELQ